MDEEFICLAIIGLIVLLAISVLVWIAIVILKGVEPGANNPSQPSEESPPVVYDWWLYWWPWLFALLAMPFGANAQPKFAQWIAVPGLQYNLYQAAGTNAFVVVTNLIVSGTNANVPLPFALAPGSYRFYTTSISNGVESLPSNIFTVPPAPTTIAGTKGTVKRSP